MSDIIDSVHARLRAAGYKFASMTPRMDGTRLEFWSRDGQTIILHDYKTDGFEIYKPACQSNDLEKTLKAIGA